MSRRWLVVILCCSLAACFGGCIFDSDDGCETGYVIAGCVRDMAGAPMAGIKVRAFFDPMEGVDPVPDCSTHTNSRGCYSIQYPPAATEVYVYPTGEGMVFSPYGWSYHEPEGPLYSQDFVGYRGETYTVSGRVSDTEGHDLAAIYITLKDSYGVFRDDAVTDALGNYTLEGLAPNVDYVVTPSSFCVFEPKSRSYSAVSENLTGQDFTGTCELQYVEGYVRDAHGAPVEGAGLRIECICHCDTDLLGSTQRLYTDEAGYYLAVVFTSPDCACQIYPEMEGCRFLPHYSSYGGLEGDATGEDYIAYCGDGYTIDGRVRTADGDPCEGALLQLGRKDDGDLVVEVLQTHTDETGYYEFDNLVPGVDYRLVPSHRSSPSGDSCEFEPSEMYYSGLDGHKHDQDFGCYCP